MKWVRNGDEGTLGSGACGNEVKARVAVDLDGVAYDFVGGVIRYLYQKHEIRKTREDVTEYSVSRMTGIPRIDDDLLRTIYKPSFYSTLDLYPGAREAMARLTDLAQVHIITSRPLAARSVTDMVVRKHFPSISDIHYTRKKPRLARALRIRYAVEDHGPTVKEYIESRIRVWMVKHPYSDALSPGRYLSIVGGFSEAADEIISKITQFSEV